MERDASFYKALRMGFTGRSEAGMAWVRLWRGREIPKSTTFERQLRFAYKSLPPLIPIESLFSFMVMLIPSGYIVL